MEDIEFRDWPSRKRARFLNGLSGYRMAFLVGTGPDPQLTNLALFNSICHVGSQPPLLGLIFRPLTVERHTYDLIRETGCLTLNTVPQSAFANAHQTSAKFPREVSEFDACGFSAGFREGFKAPYVKESPLHIGCRYSSESLIEENQCIFMVVSIDWVQADPTGVGPDGLIDHPKLGHTGVIGLDTYYTGELLGRLAYAEPNEPVKPLDLGT